jgi:hypothetical protein
MAAFPPPVQSESLAVPGDHSFGLNYHECGLPTTPERREPNPHKSVGDAQTQPMATAGALEDQELMPEGKDLGLQCCPNSTGLPNRRE